MFPRGLRDIGGESFAKLNSVRTEDEYSLRPRCFLERQDWIDAFEDFVVRGGGLLELELDGLKEAVEAFRRRDEKLFFGSRAMPESLLCWEQGQYLALEAVQQ